MGKSSKPLDQATRADRQRFYNRAAWRKLRALKLAVNPWCERDAAKGRTFPASHVHHVVDVVERPDLALELGNLQALCPTCHNAESARRMAA